MEKVMVNGFGYSGNYYKQEVGSLLRVVRYSSTDHNIAVKMKNGVVDYFNRRDVKFR